MPFEAHCYTPCVYYNYSHVQLSSLGIFKSESIYLFSYYSIFFLLCSVLNGVSFFHSLTLSLLSTLKLL